MRASEVRAILDAIGRGESEQRGQDGLDSAESDELIFKLISPHRPGLIQSGDDGGFIYLVMPVRLNV